MAAQAARFCLRAIQNERVFLQLERAKVEQGKLYRAAQALGAALSEKDVVEAGVKAAREIRELRPGRGDPLRRGDADARGRRRQERRREDRRSRRRPVRAQRRARLDGRAEPVPAAVPRRVRGGTARSCSASACPGRRIPSLLVLPLVLHERALGTLILGAKRRHAFGDPVRPTLEVLASHLAVSLSNARMVQKLETMATTDGLTGLFNKRAMLDSAAQKIAASARFDRKLAVLVTDIDLLQEGQRHLRARRGRRGHPGTRATS